MTGDDGHLYTLWDGANEASKYWLRRYLGVSIFGMICIIGILIELYFLSAGGKIRTDFTQTFALIMLAMVTLYIAAIFRRVMWGKTRLILKLNFTDVEVVLLSMKKRHYLPYSYLRDAEIKLIKLNKYGSSSPNKRPYFAALSPDDFTRYDTMMIFFGTEDGSDFVHLYLRNTPTEKLRQLGKEWLERYAYYMKNERVVQRRETLDRLREVNP